MRSQDVSVSLTGLVESINVLKKVEKAVKLISARAMASVIVDIFAKAQPRVPIKTGKLRESGRAYIRFGNKTIKTIAKGNVDGTVTADLGGITLSSITGTNTIKTNVTYYRESTRSDFDVAQWTHFNINPQGGSSPAARAPGTGPFYLMIPFEQNQNKYLRFLKDVCAGREFDRTIALASKITQKRVGKYGVDFVDIVLSRIESRGYYG